MNDVYTFESQTHVLQIDFGLMIIIFAIYLVLCVSYSIQPWTLAIVGIVQIAFAIRLTTKVIQPVSRVNQQPC